jgi:hypothetical protein
MCRPRSPSGQLSPPDLISFNRLPLPCIVRAPFMGSAQPPGRVKIERIYGQHVGRILGAAQHQAENGQPTRREHRENSTVARSYPPLLRKHQDTGGHDARR